MASAAVHRRFITAAVSYVRQSGAHPRALAKPNAILAAAPFDCLSARELSAVSPTPGYSRYMPKRMFHEDRHQQLYNAGQEWEQQRVDIPNHQGVLLPDQHIIMPEQPQLYIPDQRLVMPNHPQIYMPRVIPLLPTEGMPCPARTIAPISQVSNPLVILDDRAWTLHDLIMRYPLWKRITKNPLVHHEAYVMHEVWRWCLRSIARLCAANNRLGITIAPAIFKSNFRVSSRSFEASLIDPIGFHFQDERLQEILKQLHANEMGLVYAAFANLVTQLSNEYHPHVPIPQDSTDWLCRMFSRNVNFLIQESIVNDPCLMQPYGRLGFTNHVDDLIRTVLPCIYDASDEEHRVSDEVLVALALLEAYDGSYWGDLMMAEPLFLHHYAFATNGSLPPRESEMYKKPHPRQEVLIQMGRCVSGVLRSGLRHSIEKEVKLIHALRKQGPYTLLNVIEHQHCNFPDFPGTVIKVMIDNRVYSYLYMDHYFYEHPRHVPELECGDW